MRSFFRRSRLSVPKKPAAPRSQLEVQSLESRDVPAAFVVTTTADSGAGSLRDAVDQANKLAGPDVIKFDTALPNNAVIHLNGPIAITDSVDIQGPGADK